MPLLFLLCFSLLNAAQSQDLAQAVPTIVFESVNLGILEQGIKKNVEIKGKNVSSKTIEVENVIDQMTGGENFQFPKKIAPNEKFTIKFTLNTKFMEGSFAHNIVLIDTAGKPFVAAVSGEVENPIVFSERIFDLGFYKTGEEKTWIFYAWNAQGKPLKLKLASPEFYAEFADVKLNVSDFENIKEVGNSAKTSIESSIVPAVKITLSVKNLTQYKPSVPPATPKILPQKSIRKIVSFTCENFPNATPEVLVAGYWSE